MARPPSFNPWLAAAFVGGIGYPLLVYFGRHTLPPIVLVAVAVALIGLRLVGLRTRISARTACFAFTLVIVAAMALTMLHQGLAIKAYPIVMSLGIAGLFGYSLISPPSAVERMARLHQPDLSPEGVIYTRRVTIVWVIFLVANAGISACTALWGTLEQWALWNGLIAYVLMGTLFIGEYGIRKLVQR